MNTRLFAMGAAIFGSAVLAACGGGGGGGGITPSTPTPIPATPTPTPTPTANPYGCVGQAPFAQAARRPLAVMAVPPHPIASGDTFAYSGTLSRTYAQSAPCPEPTATTSAAIAISVSDSSAASPSGATDSKSTETDAFPTQTTVSTTDQIVKNTSTQFLLYSTTSKDSIGDTIATNYTNPQVLDTLPESAGQTWGPNDPAGSVNETLADGTRIARAVAADGSYIDTETFVDGTTAKIVVDGAANAKPLDGGGVYAFAGTAFTYAPPAAGNITLTIGTQPPKTRTFPAWFTVPKSYASDTFVDNGLQAFDPKCAVKGAIGTSGNQIVETSTLLDPVLGYTETRLTTSYVVPGFGAACVKIDDTLNSYYDYQSDTTKIDYQSQNGQPNSVDQIVEYLGMAAPVSPYPALRRQSDTAVSPLAVAGRISAIEQARALELARRIEALHAFAKQFAKKGTAR